MVANKPLKRPTVTLKDIEILGPKKYGITMYVNDTYKNIRSEVYVLCTSGLVQGEAVQYGRSLFSKLCIETIKRGAALWAEEYERNHFQDN
ncbi:hypothetical protein [Bacillus sp. Brlt_9]|uniref:hypothetical protein n=1 Tax=Bacillus sp. Brlt_9 TaxID=3110916 RepID=UPI003F7B83F2